MTGVIKLDNTRLADLKEWLRMLAISELKEIITKAINIKTTFLANNNQESLWFPSSPPHPHDISLFPRIKFNEIENSYINKTIICTIPATTNCCPIIRKVPIRISMSRSKERVSLDNFGGIIL